MAPKVVQFEGYEVDLEAGQIRKRGVTIGLREKSFQVLAALLEHPGKLVTREELRRRLWPQDVFVDFENNLNTAMARLREALNDSADRPRFIETLPKRGYRFISTVSELAREREQRPVPKSRLAVLPFANLSGDTAQEYLADAITEELISELASLAPERLGVIARTTAMHYKRSHKDVARIGRELAVEYVVEGSVRRADDRIAINTQLIRVSDQTHLWANRLEAEPREIIGVQNTIAQGIAGRIDASLPRRSVGKPTEDLLAYRQYIQGRYELNRWVPDGIVNAKQCFEAAVARDPNFALAYDSLAEVCWWIGFHGLVPPKEAFSAGITHALRALEIDNTLAETHALLGMYRKELEYNWPEVRREMDRALQLNPASPAVRFRFAVSGLLPVGRVGDAAAEIERALESDPLSLYMRCWRAEMLFLGRDYDQAIGQARLVLELDPTYYFGHFVTGQALLEQRLFQDAVAALHKAVEFSGGVPIALASLGMALARSGNTPEARAVLERLRQSALERYVPSTSFAWIQLGLGEIDRAFDRMDQAVEERDPVIVAIKTLPFLDPIRGHSRYQALLRKMNLLSGAA